MISRLRFVDRPSTVPNSIYLDTSYLVEVFVHTTAKGNKSYPNGSWGAAAFNLLVWLRANKVAVVTSALAIEEAYHILLFGEINKEVKSRLFRNWKELRLRDPIRFEALWQRGFQVVRAFHKFIRGMNLLHLPLGATLPDQARIHRTITYSRALLGVARLDAMDAFHVAIARVHGVDWAATTDPDWKSVHTISTFTPS